MEAPKTITVAEATEQLITLESDIALLYRIYKTGVTAVRNAKDEVLRLESKASADLKVLEQKRYLYATVVHAARGRCQAVIRDGSGWHRHDRSCVKKAKAEGLCGVHLNKKKRDEEFSAKVSRKFDAAN